MAALKSLFLAGCAASVLLFPGTALSTGSGDGSWNTCWSKTALRGRPEEKLIRNRIREAFVRPPAMDYVKDSPVPSHLRGSIRRVELPPGVKLIALTLDLCEAPAEIAGYDGGVIDYLREHNIRATLFAGGKWLLSHRERAEQLVADPLFEIGNHAWTHGNFRNISSKSMESEILNAQKAYQVTYKNVSTNSCIASRKREIGKTANMKLFRFPYGSCREDSLKMVGDSGLLAIQWDLATGDPGKGQSAGHIAAQVLKKVKPGSIIIAHANGRGWNTAKALPLFIPKLIEKGYKFVTVSELLAAGKPVISQYCYDTVPGDTNRYDRPIQRRTTRFDNSVQR